MVLTSLFIFSFICLGGIVTCVSPVTGVVIYILTLMSVIIFIRPVYGFFIVYMLAPLQNVNIIFDSPLRIVTERYSAFIFFFICIWLITLIHAVFRNVHGNLRTMKFEYWLLFFFLFWSVISIFWTIDVYHGINTIANLSSGLAFFFLILHFCKDKKTLEWIFRILIFHGLFLGILFFLSNKMELEGTRYYFTQNLYFDINLIKYGLRPGGFAPPQLAGTITSFFLFSGIAIFPKVNTLKKILLIILGFFFLSNIIATGSKGAAGAFFIGMIFFLLVYPGIRKWFFISIPTLFACIIFVLIFNAIFLKSDRLTKSAKQQTLSLSFRLNFWKAGLNMMSERGIGAGVGGFARLVDPWPGAHSFYFSIFFDLGIIGIGILFSFLSFLLFRLRRAILFVKDKDMKRYLYCMASVLIVFFIHGIVDIAYDLPFVWMIFGTVASVITISEKTYQKEAKSPNYQEGTKPFSPQLTAV